MEDGSLLTKHFRANLGLPSVLMCETASHFKVPLGKKVLCIKKASLKKNSDCISNNASPISWVLRDQSVNLIKCNQSMCKRK